MAFLGAIGKTLGLGSTADVLGGAARRAFGLPTQQAPAVESASTVSIDNTFETPSSGDEGYRTVGQGMFQANPLLTRLPQVSDRVRDIIIGVGGGEIFRQGANLFDQSGQVCEPKSMKPYNVNKETGCITITRKQQLALKDALKFTDIPTLAASIGLDPMQLCQLLIKRFKARGRGITPASMRTTKRTIRQIKNLHNEVASMAARKAPARRRAAAGVSLIKN